MEKLFNGLPLSLDADTFFDLKNNFNQVLTETLNNMIENQEDKGTITLKLKITLHDRTNDLGNSYKEPYFSHEVTGAVQQKCTAKGSLYGDYALEFGSFTNGYVLRPSDVAQTTLDDYAMEAHA